MINSTVILGSTGSIGRQSVEVCKRLGIKAAALTTNKNIDLLLEQTKALRPEYVCAFDAGANERLRAALQGTGVAVGHSGEAGLIEAATWNSAECVVTAVSGAVGLRPTLAAIDAKKRIALANKETLVCAGSVVMARAREKGAEIVPVDSEHSAVFQCLTARRGELRKVLLTGSSPGNGREAPELVHGREDKRRFRHDDEQGPGVYRGHAPLLGQTGGH